jgi:FtsX-like permease family protein
MTSTVAIRAALWVISRVVPAHARARWIEEWRAELEHAPRAMLLGALPDAWALRRLPARHSTGAWRTDAKQTLRSLARSPWHVLTVSVCLGIGIAVTVTTFSILAAIISGDMPGVSDRSRLMKIVLTVEEGRGPTWSGISLNDYTILREGTPHLPDIAAEGSWPINVTVVGVVSNAFSRPISPAPQASIYLPLREVPDYLAVYVRTKQSSAVRQQIRDTMAAIDPDLPAVAITTVADRFETDAGDIRLIARAASGLGLSALLLAIAGVYSVVAFLVSLRTQEFGIRLAIGARPRDIVNMVVAQSSGLVIVGLVAGLVLGTPLLIFIARAFPYASAFDPLGLLGPSAGLALTALIAAAIPARKAARVDPCLALRSE